MPLLPPPRGLVSTAAIHWRTRAAAAVSSGHSGSFALSGATGGLGVAAPVVLPVLGHRLLWRRPSTAAC
jgi:hypothetical protein